MSARASSPCATVWVGFALVWLTLAHPARAEEQLTLELGEQRVLSSEGVRSYSEGTPGIVDVRLTPDSASFVLVGVRVGRTSLLLLTHHGEQVQDRIEVLDP